MKILCGAAIFISLASYCLAAEIKGKITSIEGKPIHNAIVLHQESGNKTFTDEQGAFLLNVPHDRKGKLRIIHPDYIEKEILFTSADFSERLIITLTPYIRQSEEIVVTALRYPEASTSVPAAETVVSTGTISEKMTPNITEAIISMPGVASIGVGGFSKAPNIRGLARRRVLILIDNARVTSDRRTGPNASFVNPDDIEKIEILRSPSSVFYGSDAIGGVIHILTKEASSQLFQGQAHLSYNTNNEGKKAGISLSRKFKNLGFYLSFQGRDAKNYSSPLGEVPMSHFSAANLFFKVSHQSGKRRTELSFLGARGFDIGKPNIDSSVRPTWYPKETQNLLIFHWEERKFIAGGDLSFHCYFNPNSLETKKEKLSSYKEKESYALTKSNDYGFQLSYNKKIKKYFRLTAGADFFGRTNVEAKNEDTYFNPEGEITRTRASFSLKNGQRRDFGVFISEDYSGIKKLDLVAGLRWDFLSTRVTPVSSLIQSSSSSQAWTGFVGASWDLPMGFIVFANLSRAYRFPSLNELYYTGITGRGYVIGNPNLNPETSFNFDLGLKLIRKKLFAGLYLFHYRIDNMIERYRNPENIYTYDNIEKGKIKGFEFELEYYPIPGWKIFGNFYSYQGKSEKTGAWLNDIPPDRLVFGSRFWKGHFWGEINCYLQSKRDDPGPAEISIPGFSLLNIQSGYYLSPSFHFYFRISNLLNRTYRSRPDPDSPEEPARGFSFGLTCRF
ncbi:MAG: TonB-dependent receptor domain-containing protein [Candidatus Aminicenantia bacterium]